MSPKESQSPQNKAKKNVEYIIEKSEAYISRIYLIKYADNFHTIEGKEFESAVNDEAKFKHREELITYALKADMPNVHYAKKKKLEAISTFKPFNIKELEIDVNSKNRVQNHQKEFEQKGLRVRSTKRRKESDSRRKSQVRRKEDREEEDKYGDRYGHKGKSDRYEKSERSHKDGKSDR